MHIRQDFFDDLLSGKLHSAEEVGSIAGMHNMDAEGTYLCMVTKLDSAARGTENYVEMQDAFLRIKDRMIAQIGELSREEGRSCISIHRGSLIITFLRIVHTEPDQRISEENRRFIQRLYHRLHAITQQYVLNIGVGEPTAVLSMCAAALPRRRRLSGSPAICAAWQGCIFTRTSSSISCLAAEWKMKNPPSFIRCLSAVW